MTPSREKNEHNEVQKKEGKQKEEGCDEMRRHKIL